MMVMAGPHALPDWLIAPAIEYTDPMSLQLLTADDVAKRLRVSRRAFFALRARGGFVQPVRLGARMVRYREADVEAWIAERVAKG